MFWEESQQQVSVLVLCLEDVLCDYHDGLNYLSHHRLLELGELGHLFKCLGLNYLSHHRLPELCHLFTSLGLNHLRNLFTCFSLDLMVSVLLLPL